MPIKAAFTGDVSDLQRSTQRARDEFRQVGQEAEKTGRVLKAAGSTFDGTRIEGAARKAAAEFRKFGDGARLTAQELQKVERPIQAALDKFRVMGATVPQELQKVAREIAHIRALEEDTARATQRTTEALRAQGRQVAQNSAQPRGSNAGAGLSAFTGGLGFAVGTGASFAALAVGGAAIRDIVQQGAALGPLAQNFERLQGGATQAASSLVAMQNASRGLVSELDLLQAANQASVLGLTSMGVDMETLVGTATTLGRAVGRDATMAIGDLIGALGRGSTEVLDNLGVQLKMNEAYEIYAARLGTTVTALDDQQKKQAFVTIAMERATAAAARLGDQELTAAENASRLATAIGDLAARAASGVNESSLLSSAIGVLADEFEGIVENVTGVVDAYGDLQRGGGELSTTLSEQIMQSEQLAEAMRLFVSPALYGVNAAADTLRRTLEALAIGRVIEEARGFSFSGGLQFDTPNLPSLQRGRDITLADRTMGASGRAQSWLDEEVKRLQEDYGKDQERRLNALQNGLEKATAGTNKLAEAMARLTGADRVKAAEELADHINTVGAAQIPTSQVEALAQQLMEARDIARETGQAISQDIGRALNSLQIPSSRVLGINTFNQGLLDIQSGGLVRDNAAMLGRTAGFGGPITSTNPLQFTTLAPSLTRTSTQFAGVTARTKDWRIELQGVAQAFAQMAQAAGPALDGVTRSAGVMLTSANAAEQLSRALRMVDERGNLTRGGQALAGGMAGLTTGLQLGSLTQNRTAGGIMGGIGGGAAGWLATGTGVGLGVGLAAGAIGGVWAAHQNRQAQRAQMEQLRQDAITAAGGLEELQREAVRAGFSVEEFMRRFQSSDPRTFTGVINDMNQALAQQRVRAQALATALDSVAQVQGVISQQQMAQIRNTDPEGDGAEAVVAFIEAQRQQTLQGILRAAAALEQMASLTDDQLEALTEGVTDGDERARRIEAALRDRAGSVMGDLRAGVQATASAIFVAINDALQSGERLVDVLAVLAPAIETVKNLFQRSGQAPGAGFAQVESYQRIATGPQTGPALELATGLGQALAGMANTGLLSPELFGEIANGIGAAYKQMELLGQGGLDAARLMQPALQAIWQQVEDFPGFEDTLDDDTKALLDFAQQSGLVGDKFRPAIDRMIQAVDRLIERFDDFLSRMGNIPPVNIPVNYVPGAPSGTPPPGNPAPPGEPPGGDYPMPHGLASGGIVMRPTMALIGEGGEPEAVIPLSRWASMAGPQSQTIVVEMDRYVVARASATGMPAYLRVRGAA